LNICIYGASSASLSEVYYTEAEKCGLAIAKHGHTLVFGGGREGLMGACARGVHSGGGKTLGIAPKFFDEPGILDKSCTEFLFTETMRERKALMEEKSDACLVLPGGIGTLEEFFEMLTLKQLGQSDRAIVIYNINGYFDKMLGLLEFTVKEKFMSESCLGLYFVAYEPESMLDYIESYKPQTGSVRRLADYSK